MRIGQAAGLLILTTTAPGSFAVANDSVAETAAGGLILRQTDDIDMVSEDLYVSADRIRVRYVFRNRASRDVEVTVAFPMPDRDLAMLRESDVAFPADFSTRVDGAPVGMQVERKAMLGGVDHGALLERLGIPIAGDNLILAAAEAVERLTPDQRRQLVELGLVEPIDTFVDQGVRVVFEPLWTVRETWHWRQAFPAGRDLVVEHDYTPGAGAGVATMLAFPELRDSPEGRRQLDDYCVEPGFLAAVDRMTARAAADGTGPPAERWVRYILTTGANWRAPIGEFRLVVDKGRPENIVSFCGTGMRRIGPTQFEMRRHDWRPDRDLAVLIIEPVARTGE